MVARMGRRRDVSMSDLETIEFLEASPTAVLSTVGRNGYPHAAAMWFALQDRELWMWTYAKSQKAINVRRNPKVAFLVEDGEAYSDLRGVLVTGDVRVEAEFESVAAIGRLLYDRYTLPRTGIPAADGPIEEIERQARKRVGLILPLDDLASWDHRKLT